MSTGTGQMVERGAGAEAADVELGDGREYMTADELARRLRVSTAWIYTETRAGRIPHVRLGRYVRYRRSAIAAWERKKEGGLR
jgi:excisionase family DNA binding protein